MKPRRWGSGRETAGANCGGTVDDIGLDGYSVGSMYGGFGVGFDGFSFTFSASGVEDGDEMSVEG